MHAAYLLDVVISARLGQLDARFILVLKLLWPYDLTIWRWCSTYHFVYFYYIYVNIIITSQLHPSLSSLHEFWACKL